jgi:deaminated glutathione amidase
MKVGLVQLNSGDDPACNLVQTERLVYEAAAAGAAFVLTPEMTNILCFDREWADSVVCGEADDPTLARLREVARDCDIWLLIGSLAIRDSDGDGRFANRSFLISPVGEIVGRYDKIHMFDVDLGPGESYRESSRYRAGEQAIITNTVLGCIGMSICYDMRFPQLYRALGQAGAQIITVPSAFTVPTGSAHWHVLLRARAIETGCYILAPAQCGDNAASHGRSRQTYGRSLIINPWGEVLADGGDSSGVTYAEIDLDAVAVARGKIPSLAHDRAFGGPVVYGGYKT